MNRFALLFLIGLMLLGEQSCKWLSRNHYKIDNPSPTGAYRVKAHVTVEDDDRLMGGFHEWGGIQFLKGDEILYSYSRDYTDNFETTFRGRHQYVTWSADNLLYMGANELTKDSPVDEIVITNRTKEDIRYLDISISKLTRVVVFDLAGASEITTHVPIVRGWSNREDEVNYSLGFHGKTSDLREFRGVRSGSHRKATPNELTRIQVEIGEGDLKQFR